MASYQNKAQTARKVSYTRLSALWLAWLQKGFQSREWATACICPHRRTSKWP